MPRYGSITRSLGQGIRVELDGDWTRLSTVVDKMPKEIATAALAAQEAVALKYKRKLKKNIRQGRFQLAPLSPYYQMNKSSLGGGSTPLVWTGQMVRSIVLRHNRAGNMIQVTIDENARYGPGLHGNTKAPRLSIKQIANILEHGSDARNIPARPVWRLTYQEMGGQAYFRTFVGNSLAQRLSRTLR